MSKYNHLYGYIYLFNNMQISIDLILTFFMVEI